MPSWTITNTAGDGSTACTVEADDRDGALEAFAREHGFASIDTYLHARGLLLADLAVMLDEPAPRTPYHPHQAPYHFMVGRDGRLVVDIETLPPAAMPGWQSPPTTWVDRDDVERIGAAFGMSPGEALTAMQRATGAPLEMLNRDRLAASETWQRLGQPENALPPLDPRDRLDDSEHTRRLIAELPRVIEVALDGEATPEAQRRRAARGLLDQLGLEAHFADGGIRFAPSVRAGVADNLQRAADAQRARDEAEGRTPSEAELRLEAALGLDRFTLPSQAQVDERELPPADSAWIQAFTLAASEMSARRSPAFAQAWAPRELERLPGTRYLAERARIHSAAIDHLRPWHEPDINAIPGVRSVSVDPRQHLAVVELHESADPRVVANEIVQRTSATTLVDLVAHRSDDRRWVTGRWHVVPTPLGDGRVGASVLPMRGYEAACRELAPVAARGPVACAACNVNEVEGGGRLCSGCRERARADEVTAAYYASEIPAGTAAALLDAASSTFGVPRDMLLGRQPSGFEPRPAEVAAYYEMVRESNGAALDELHQGLERIRRDHGLDDVVRADRRVADGPVLIATVERPSFEALRREAAEAERAFRAAPWPPDRHRALKDDLADHARELTEQMQAMVDMLPGPLDDAVQAATGPARRELLHRLGGGLCAWCRADYYRGGRCWRCGDVAAEHATLGTLRPYALRPVAAQAVSDELYRRAARSRTSASTARR